VRLYTAEEVRQFPPIIWLIHGILPMSSFGVLFGPKGVGKTFVGLSMAHAISEGQRWLGRRVRRGSVVYVMAGEGVSGLKSRLEAWDAAYTPVTSTYYQMDAVQLHQTGSVQTFLRLLKEESLDPLLIIFDTLARCSAGANENEQQDMGLIVGACDHIRQQTGAALLLVHHTGHPDEEGKHKRRPRGSSSLPAAVDTEIEVSEDEQDPHQLILRCEKQRDAEKFKPIRCYLRLVRRAGKELSKAVMEA